MFTDKEVEKFSLKRGDILMCEGGVPGHCAIWREDNSPIKYQKALHRIRLYKDLPEYVAFFFEAIQCDLNFERLFTGATIKHLPRERLVEIELPLPPLSVQRLIVARLAAAERRARLVAPRRKARRSPPTCARRFSKRR